jgi:hypothetical protein
VFAFPAFDNFRASIRSPVRRDEPARLSGSRLSDVDEVRLSLYSPAGTNGKSAAGDVAAVG